MRNRSQFCTAIFAALSLVLFARVAHADSLDDLARDFWTWRATELPISTDDIPRLERPPRWIPDWSPKAVGDYRARVGEFEARFKAIDATHWPVSRQVDYRLIGSAIARARWELDYLAAWKKNPNFYLDQTVGAYFHLLLVPPPFSAERSSQIVATLQAVPRTLVDGRKNLTNPIRPFAELALDQLSDLSTRLQQSTAALKPMLELSQQSELDAAASAAISALEDYRAWLKKNLTAMAEQSSIGRDGYVYFLRNIAILPYTPEQLLAIGRGEWARSVSFQAYEERRNLGLPNLRLPASIDQEIEHEKLDEESIRKYLVEKRIMSVPAGLRHYIWRPMPEYMKPLESFGETDDFTSPSRLKEDGIRYINAPTPKLGYFALADAKDPRIGIVHEGVPGHYFQLALDWSHPDPIRRHYYDSGANEGIGFYSEEMLLAAGLFDNSPRSREIIYNMVRLRALRVEVDVKLALGDFTIAQGAEYLEKTVPMDPVTAHAEAKFFASSPGQAISYQIGKTQIMNFLAEAKRQQGEKFDLQAFHDFLWLNGNVPIALQRWEYLGLKDDLQAVDAMNP